MLLCTSYYLAITITSWIYWLKARNPGDTGVKGKTEDIPLTADLEILSNTGLPIKNGLPMHTKSNYYGGGYTMRYLFGESCCYAPCCGAHT